MTDTITIIGNLGNEPEQRTLVSGVSVTHFSVGSTHRRFDKATGQWVDAYTNWYSVSAYRALGDHALASLRKGQRVIVSGRLKVSEWDNGTTKGKALDLEAEAVGHDLLFGTSTFHKDGGPNPVPAAPEPGQVAAAEPAAAATDASGWAIPAAPEPALTDTPF
jgi:single-strand DNA-binding protein